MAKSFKSFRFPPELRMHFKQLVSGSGYTVTGAFEKFMEICVLQEAWCFLNRVGSMIWKRKPVSLLTWLRKERYWCYSGSIRMSVRGRLLQLLRKVRDVNLKKQIEEGLKKH